MMEEGLKWGGGRRGIEVCKERVSGCRAAVAVACTEGELEERWRLWRVGT